MMVRIRSGFLSSMTLTTELRSKTRLRRNLN